MIPDIVHTNRWRPLLRVALPAMLGATILGSGCELRQAMYDQPRYEPLEASEFFADGMSARPPVPGTVARGQLRLDEHMYTGKVNGELATSVPFEVDEAFLRRGRERFDIYCSPCHDRLGRRNGIVVQRGMNTMRRLPSSFHQQRLLDAPVGHFFEVMTDGFGAMYNSASRVSVRDRWAIAAYIRVLQLSQHIRLEDLPAEDRKHFE